MPSLKKKSKPNRTAAILAGTGSKAKIKKITKKKY